MTTATAIYQNGAKVTKEYDGDTCPIHGTEVRKDYDFGLNDATVTVFSGCKCAVCVNSWNDAYYYTSYTAAAGKATMTKQQNKW